MNIYSPIITGSVELTGSLTIFGPLNATASNALTSSYAATASYALNGGGGTAEIGVATLNFGEPPGTNTTSASISSSIVNNNSYINIYIMNTSSLNHNIEDHKLFALYSRVGVDNIIDNTSFDITGITDLRINGEFKVKYIITNN